MFESKYVFGPFLDISTNCKLAKAPAWVTKASKELWEFFKNFFYIFYSEFNVWYEVIAAATILNNLSEEIRTIDKLLTKFTPNFGRHLEDRKYQEHLRVLKEVVKSMEKSVASKAKENIKKWNVTKLLFIILWTMSDLDIYLENIASLQVHNFFYCSSISIVYKKMTK